MPAILFTHELIDDLVVNSASFRCRKFIYRVGNANSSSGEEVWSEWTQSGDKAAGWLIACQVPANLAPVQWCPTRRHVMARETFE